MKVKDFTYLNQNPKHWVTLALSKVVNVRHLATRVVVPVVLCRARADRRFHYMILARVDETKRSILRPHLDALGERGGEWYGYGYGHCQLALCHFDRPDEYRLGWRQSETAWVNPHWHTLLLTASIGLAANGFSFLSTPVPCFDERLKGLLHVVQNDSFRPKNKAERFYCD